MTLYFLWWGAHPMPGNRSVFKPLRRTGVAAADSALGRRGGEIATVGEGVIRWKEGDRVAGTF